MPNSNFPSRRVLIFGESIFEEGIARLLESGAGLQVLGARYTDDFAFLNEIAQKQPDVIMLNESTPQNTAQILKLLFSIPSLASLRVVVIRLSNNMIDVYEMPKRFAVTKQDELVAIVRGISSKM